MSGSPSTEKLFLAIKNDDYISYNTLFTYYYAPLCQYVYSLLKDKEDTEDVVQELFLRLWNNRRKITIEENMSGYLYKMAKNRTLNHIRFQSKYKAILEKQEGDMSGYEDDRLESKEIRMALYDCIDRLPGRLKEVLLLHRIKELKQKEISEKLNISIQTIKNQIWMSLQKLRKCLEMKQAL